jgi:hypothetical protein
MPSVARPVAVLAITLVIAACTAAPTSSGVPAASPAGSPPASAAARTPRPTAAPKPTATMAAASAPAATAVGTTQTSWGKIVDAVPSAFPVFPDAAAADPPPSGPVSGAWVATAPVSEVAAWYRDALVAANFAKVDLGDPLEDGSQVIDAQGDVPECRAQVTVKPAGTSTMITVLLGAGCAGGEG